MHAYGTACLCVVSGLLNVVYTEKSLLNICTADLHQDIHVKQDIQQRYVDVSWIPNAFCKLLLLYHQREAMVVAEAAVWQVGVKI